MGLGGVINNLLSLGTKLLPTVIAAAQAPSSSNCPSADQNHKVEAELKKMMRMLERIKATLYDAEQREIRDESVKLWLKELNGVAYDAEDVLGEYHYEVLRAEVEARDASSQDSHKRKLIQVPYGMLDQIQQIRSRFDEIMKDRIALQLSEGDGPMRCNNKLQIAPVGPFVVESNIFGRESEKEKLIELLSSERDVVSVVTIVGMGGIGKTTLAQLAYNDQRIRQRFDKFGWICVSEDFNVERLTKESLESITGNVCGITNLGALQEKLLRVISGKRVLLVLDDVWNEKKSFWDSFQTPFMSAKFAKILVTTRNDPVARIMQTEPTFKIGCLSTEQCWQLFEHYAFGGVDQNKSPNLVGIGKQIMKKCGMLPLAVKSIASLLRHEAEEESWREILESELWETDASNEIFPPLQISYARLPTYLKSCFLYCSMFPKDHVYDAEALVKLWMYQGFIESKGNKTPKKIGFEYAQQLCQRSLFEREVMYERNDLGCSKFKLHDIVHDLARRNSENVCFSIEVDKLPIFPTVLHHLYIADRVILEDPIPSDKFTTLRTLITPFIKNGFNTFDFSMAPKLRALEIRNKSYDFSYDFYWAALMGSCCPEFDQSLSSIGNLKHIRYLSLGNVGTLPEYICSLYSLRYLSFKGHSIIELPNNIGNLISLEELIINGCANLEVLPESLCQLKALRELSICSCVKIKELPNNIGNLISLEELIINGCANLEVLPESLCQLKALRELSICSCVKIKELPNNIGNLISLEELIINGCDNLEVLPESLCQLKVLRELSICSCVKIKELPNNIGNLISLEELIINGCANLEVLPDSLCQLKALRKLSICSCVKIKELPNNIGNLISLEELIINGCANLKVLPDSLCQLKALRELSICSCVKIKELPNNIGNLISLEELIINGCANLEVLPDSLCQLKALRKLSICSCVKIKELPNNIGNLISLEELIINGCDNLKVLPESLCQLKALRKLYIFGRHKIKELSNNIGNVVSLEELRIERCSGLRVLPGSLCQLKALRKLCLIGWVLLGELPSDIGSLTDLKTRKIRDTGVSCLPSLSKFVEIQELNVRAECKTIGWLKDFPVLGRTLCLNGLKNISNLIDVQCANLMSMHNLEHLALNWNEDYGWKRFPMPKLIGTRLHSIFQLNIERGENILLEEQSCFSVMASLQPHPNLTKLEIAGYKGISFPEWIGSLCKLKYLKITSCDSLQFLKTESLPLELEQLEICWCGQLVSIPGIQNLKSLVKLSISDCQNLCSFMEPSLKLTIKVGVGSYGTSLLGLTNLPSLRSLYISTCKKLQVLVHELRPAEPCKVEVWECPGLKEWCLQHEINYKGFDFDDYDYDDDDDDDDDDDEIC